MAIYKVVRGGRIAAGEKPKRRVDLWCAARGSTAKYLGGNRWLASDGREIVFAPNRDGNRPPSEQSTDPCPICLRPAGPLPGDRCRDGWIRQIESSRASDGIYEIYDPKKKITQIGKAQSNIVGRVRRRFEKTCLSRLGPDTMWWVYDMLERGEEPRWRVLPIHPDEELRSAEDRWRETRRNEGWQASSFR